MLLIMSMQWTIPSSISVYDIKFCTGNCIFYRNIHLLICNPRFFVVQFYRARTAQCSALCYQCTQLKYNYISKLLNLKLLTNSHITRFCSHDGLQLFGHIKLL